MVVQVLVQGCMVTITMSVLAEGELQFYDLARADPLVLGV